ncbi:CAP domain-containing protein [Streptomyces specialis]|uniref:CAP domain-containing protein n=1 Tax=Streptomyces specialis TaxID=498367 RepID=UPI00073E9BD0|nr:CAP domain-containing protein [Streptomyces specialis]
MGRHRRRGGRARAGLIGASTALAVGAVAVTTGLLPGLGDDPALSDSDGPRALGHGSSGSPVPTPTPTPERDSAPEPAGGASSEPADEESSPAPEPDAAPSPSPSPEARGSEEAGESGAASRSPSRPEPEPEAEAEPEAGPETEAEEPSPAPSSETPEAEPEPEPGSPSPGDPGSPDTDPEPAAEAVLALVNEERAIAGCRPLTEDPELTALASAFSVDMAARDYFGHTDPDGRTPWDRAAAAGVTGLGGENIARGQADPEAVMDAWMSSDGHRANILNCAFTTIGIGVHVGAGGPWWTQEFGF